jgi:hypothetical protein
MGFIGEHKPRAWRGKTLPIVASIKKKRHGPQRVTFLCLKGCAGVYRILLTASSSVTRSGRRTDDGASHGSSSSTHHVRINFCHL